MSAARRTSLSRQVSSPSRFDPGAGSRAGGGGDNAWQDVASPTTSRGQGRRGSGAGGSTASKRRGGSGATRERPPKAVRRSSASSAASLPAPSKAGGTGAAPAASGKGKQARPKQAARAAAAAVSPPADASQLSQRYHSTKKVGEGSFSVVLKAKPREGASDKPVAIKRLNQTNHPERVLNECVFLSRLGSVSGSPVPRLLDKFRDDDSVCLVLPYFAHDDFRDRLVVNTEADIQGYLRKLFLSLAFVHQYEIIHRDIKPSNFLYNFKSKEHTLVDFGLAHWQRNTIEGAEREIDNLVQWQQKFNFDSSWTEPQRMAAGGNKRTTAPAPAAAASSAGRSRSGASARRGGSQASNSSWTGGTGSGKTPSGGGGSPPKAIASTKVRERTVARVAAAVGGGRPVRAAQARRGGTRGYRAPEVLLHVQQQTTAIDVWSAGVIMLSLLSCRYPFFNSDDDQLAFYEIAELLGPAVVAEGVAGCGRYLDWQVLKPRHERLGLKETCEAFAKDARGGEVLPLQDICYDLLQRALDPDPTTRITATEALEHPYFTDP